MAEEVEKTSYIDELKSENRRLEEDLKRYEKNRMKNKAVLDWLANNINIQEEGVKCNASVDEIEDMLRNQLAVSYLLIWPIFEQRHFDGFMQVSQIEIAAEKLKDYYNKELRTDLDKIVEYFFLRYNIYGSPNNKYYKALQPDRGIPNVIRDIFKIQRYISLQPKQKIMLLLFVIYRYRNNIFHGSKSIDKWAQYNDQINYCLLGMMKIADCMKKMNIVIPNTKKRY